MPTIADLPDPLAPDRLAAFEAWLDSKLRSHPPEGEARLWSTGLALLVEWKRRQESAHEAIVEISLLDPPWPVVMEGQPPSVCPLCGSTTGPSGAKLYCRNPDCRHWKVPLENCCDGGRQR